MICDTNFKYSWVRIAFKIIGDYVFNYRGRRIGYSSAVVPNRGPMAPLGGQGTLSGGPQVGWK